MITVNTTQQLILTLCVVKCAYTQLRMIISQFNSNPILQLLILYCINAEFSMALIMYKHCINSVLIMY